MSTDVALRRAPREIPLRVRWRLLPWWGKVIGVWLASRVVTTVFLLVFASFEVTSTHSTANPDLISFSNLWDAQWYKFIAYVGYPAKLPVDHLGEVVTNQWAFLPVFPFLARGFTLFGIPWETAAVLISLAAGLGACLVFYRLMTRFLTAEQSLFAVLVFCIAPASPMLQVGYAESLGFLLMAIALLLLVDRQYGLLFPVVTIWAFTRPGALAFAVTLAAHFIERWWRRQKEPFSIRQQVTVVGLGFYTAAIGFAWVLVAALVTGDLSAYFKTELSWRVGYVGRGELVPFSPWFLGGIWWTNWLNWPHWIGIVSTILLIGAFIAVLFHPAVRKLGLDLRTWIAGYGLYLLAVFFPQSSTVRILAPMFPIAGALSISAKPWWRTTVIAVCLVGQIVWLATVWYVTNPDWTPP
ncbi:MAG TPA: hypothetical protein VFU07_00655 [Candidatus Lumbricidophila sp.]|nr:hypothetical protein [Candidatus Lumbricidophila sp.]